MDSGDVAVPRDGVSGEPDGGAGEAGMRQAIEMLFFAYRDFTETADVVLADHGFGRAHHRVIYFVGRQPGITVSELLVILRITKQSLARVLRDLMDTGFVVQETDAEDRRRRRLHLTDRARELEAALTRRQSALIHAACAEAGADAGRGFKAVLRAMIRAEDRHRVDSPALTGDDDGARL